MASPFENWTYQDASGAYDELVEEMGGEDAYEANRLFVEEHDHWQDGAGWVGPDGGSNAAARTKILAAVERQFTPRDAIGEVLDRMANALLKNEPDIDFVPLEPIDDPVFEEGESEDVRREALAEVEVKRAEQLQEAADLRAQLAAWWDARKLWDLVRDTVKRSRWASQGVLRTWIAPGNLADVPDAGKSGENADSDETGESAKALPTGLEFFEALQLVELSAPEPGVSFVHRDPDTQQEVAVFLYTEDDTQMAELWYVDGETTVLRVVGGEEEEEHTFELGGLLPINAMDARLLITDPVRRLQRRLNFFESIIVRVGETAGFPERYTINAMPSGVWLQTPPTDGPALDKYEDEKGTTWFLHPATRTLGAAVTTELIGIEDEDDDGKKRRAAPGVVFKEPTDPEYAAKASDHAYRAVLGQCKQKHIAMDSTGEASGVAYQQARADFDDDLGDMKPAAEALVRKTLEVAIAWAEQMGAAGESVLERFRLSVTLRPRSGPITPAEQEQNNANVGAGTMAVESAMAANGIEDVEAEIERIRNSPEARVELITRQVSTILDLSREGVPMDLAAEILGIQDREQLERFRRAQAALSEGRAQEEAQDDEVQAAREAEEALLEATT